jgi:hypothetical protein
MGYLVFFVSKWYLANHGAKDELNGATSIGIMLQRFILYTLASFGSNYFPTLLIYAYMQAFKSKLLAHM